MLAGELAGGQGTHTGLNSKNPRQRDLYLTLRTGLFRTCDGQAAYELTQSFSEALAGLEQLALEDVDLFGDGV